MIMENRIDKKDSLKHFFSINVPLEEEGKVFSSKRALRGAKLGTALGIGIAAAEVGLGAASLLLEGKYQPLTGDDAFTLALFTLLHGLCFGALGTGIDTFRPTSRAMRRVVIPAFKDLNPFKK